MEFRNGPCGGLKLAVVQETVRQELDQLLCSLPQRIVDALRSREDLQELLEVVLDLGRPPQARFSTYDVYLDQGEVSQEDLEYVLQRVGDFGDDHRAGIERTLHRISSIPNRKGRVVGITCRVGRAVFGTIKIIEDLAFSGKNILLLGRPGVGKTTMLREMARVLSEEGKKRVIIVDTSNEIAGDGDVPHPAIGRSRRMQVPTPAKQHAVMIEAVENHMPEVIIIDEMGTEQEATAARTIAERGVQLIATAHGNTLANLIMNPTLSDLTGGVQTVTLGDQEARYRGTQKSVLERKAPPTFDVVVEILSWERLAVHDNVAQAVDQWLRGFPITPEVRWLDENGQVHRCREQVRSNDHTPTPWALDFVQPPLAEPERAAVGSTATRDVEANVFLFGIGRDKLEAAVDETGISVQVARELRRADLVLTTKTHYRRGSQLVKIAEASGKPVYVMRKNTMPQVQDFLRAVAKDWGQGEGRLQEEVEEPQEVLERAMGEAEAAANRVLTGESSVKLPPQRSYVRRLQHLLGHRYNVATVSQGREPHRSVMFYRT
jgi:stage III sporulation protein SpoIIIAA